MTPLEVALVLGSAMLHAAWNTATKSSDNPTAFLLAMEAAALVVVLPVLLFGFDPSEVPGAVWLLLCVSALTHALYAFTLSRTYAHAPLSLAYPIVRSTPALVPLVAVPLLGETVTPTGALGIALVAASLWVLFADGRLEARAFASRGALLAYLTLGVTVAYSIVDKGAMERFGSAQWSGPAPRALVYISLLYVMYLPLFIALSSRSVAVRDVAELFRRRPWKPFLAAGCDIGSYSLILFVLETAPVSYVAAARQSSVLFVLLLAALLLSERPGPARILGAAMNVAGVAIIALYS